MSLTTQARRLTDAAVGRMGRASAAPGSAAHRIEPAPAPRSGPAGPASRRDASIDVARAWCLVIVVVLHAMMVGVSVVSGAPVLENAMERWGGFAAASWIVQVMPLFFVLGGASSLLHWSKLGAAAERDGERRVTATSYLAARIPRLVVPALAAGVALVAVLGALALAGLPGDLIAEAGFRVSQPLWFLGVYLLCSAAVPFVAAAHRRAPWLSLAGLVALAAGVDAIRLATGIDAIGFVNLLFVWLAVQQLGFFVADGTTARLPRRALVPLAVVALAGLAAVCGLGIAPFDLLDALNPPSAALIVLGVAQLLLFEALRPRLQTWNAHPVVARVVGAINARAMTIYSWHMLVLIGLAGLLLATGIALPEPLSPDWWLTRPLWLLAVGVVVAVVVALMGRLETGRFETRRGRMRGAGSAPARGRASRRTGGPTPTRGRVWTAGAIAAAGTLGVLVGTGTPVAWVAGLTAWSVALLLVRSRGAVVTR